MPTVSLSRRSLAIAVGLGAVAIGLGLGGCERREKAETGERRSEQTASLESGAASNLNLTARQVDMPAIARAATEALPGENATVEVRVTGVDLVDPAMAGEQAKAGQGHLHYQIDQRPPVIATTATKLGFHAMPPGQHTIDVMLAANDHSPLGPRATVTVGGASATSATSGPTGAGTPGQPGAAEPEHGRAATMEHKPTHGTGTGTGTAAATAGSATLTARLVELEAKAQKGWATVAVEVQGIDLVDPMTTNLEPREGQGHLHYQVDFGPVIATTERKLSFHELEAGEHRILVVLARNDHTPLGPEQSLTVTIPEGAAQQETHGATH